MTMPAARTVAQAKLNLFLTVLAREADGHHQLETLFQRLELGDEIALRITDGARSLDVTGADLGPAEENLAWRAAEAYRARAGWPDGFAIELAKRVPAGGGLGGGSADAGAVLRLLDALNPRPIGRAARLEIAATLGADVPFLTAETPLALAWGRGERMLELPALPPRSVALAFPAFAVSTRDAYRWLDEDAAAARPPLAAATGLDDLGSWAGVTERAGNTFEDVVAARHPGIARMTRALRTAGARIALLSGSGSTVFGVFDVPPDARALERALGCPVVLTRTAAEVVATERTG